MELALPSLAAATLLWAFRVSFWAEVGALFLLDLCPGIKNRTGYSWLTNQYGLGLDNVAAFELVLPNGTITTVTSTNEDLWFGLRGGFNNFVRECTLSTRSFCDA